MLKSVQHLKAAGDWKALDELPKNSSQVRLKNRCQLQAVQEDISVISECPGYAFRDMALNGKIPGVRKASW